MSTLTLKDTLSLETRNKLLRLRGLPEHPKNDESPKACEQVQPIPSDEEYPSSQLPFSQKGNVASGPMKMVSQEKKDRDRAKELFYETKAWLESTFPKAFSFKEPKPLKVGIQREFLLVPSPYSKGKLRSCLGSYCASKAYLEAIVQGNWRYGLNGEEAEEITQEQKDHALKCLQHKKALWKKIKKYQKK